MYLISVYFDEKSNKILNGYINKIAEVTGNWFMTEHNVPPHMTISSIEARNVEALLPTFDKIKRGLPAGEVKIVSIGQILPYVMYGTVVVNEYLQSLSKVVYDAYKDIPETTISRFYQPWSWLPHVTLGKTLNKEQMQKAFCVMQESFSPFTAKITKIGIAKVNPHEDVDVWEL